MSEKTTYEVGKNKPPKNRQFGKPEGNPNGKTSEQKRLEIRNAETAMRIRERILAAAEEKLLGCDAGQILETFIENAMLKLLKDSEDRGLGSPVQPMSSPEGGPLAVQIIERVIVKAKNADA